MVEPLESYDRALIDDGKHDAMRLAIAGHVHRRVPASGARHFLLAEADKTGLLMDSLTRYDVGARLSEIAVFNRVVYLAGQIAEQNPNAGITEQTVEVLGHIDRLLAQAGTDKTRILQCQIFLKDIADIGAMNAVWDRWVPAHNAPPRATVQALLANADLLIEIVVSAALPD